MPFIEAFNAEQERKNGNAPVEKQEQEPKAAVNTEPKRMSESYHKVVSRTDIKFSQSISSSLTVITPGT